MIQSKKRALPARLFVSPKKYFKYLNNLLQTSIAPFQALVTPARKTMCKFLKSQGEIYQCTRYLRRHGYKSHRLRCKDWDIANILADMTDGNLLDMGSSDSYILENAVLKRLHGEKYGIDFQEPDNRIEGVTYLKGDCLRTPFPDHFFQHITCLSVIEHEMDYGLFAREVSRLLSQNGKLYLTFDYWTPKVTPSIKIFDREWNILDRKDVENLINKLKNKGLHLTEEIDWSLGKPLINATNYSPDPHMGYTFGLLVFKKT